MTIERVTEGQQPETSMAGQLQKILESVPHLVAFQAGDMLEVMINLPKGAHQEVANFIQEAIIANMLTESFNSADGIQTRPKTWAKVKALFAISQAILHLNEGGLDSTKEFKTLKGMMETMQLEIMVEEVIK
jgi:hypothetical protein